MLLFKENMDEPFDLTNANHIRILIEFAETEYN